MKRNLSSLLILVLFFAQGISYLRISELERRLAQTTDSVWSLQDSVNHQINSIYVNVDDKLKEQASFIESAQITLGTPDAKSLTVPVTFTLIPKEVTGRTAVHLDFGSQILPMQRSGAAFSLTMAAAIFDGEMQPSIRITEGDITRTEQNEDLYLDNIQDRLFPFLYIGFEGSWGGGSQGFDCEGAIRSDVKPASGSPEAVTYRSAHLVIQTDDAVLSKEPIAISNLDGYELDDKIPLKDGDTCTISIIATDSLGLEHHYSLITYTQGNNAQREPLFDNKEIFTKDGLRLWPRE